MEDRMFLLKPIGFILLGFLSALLSYYGKNFYVKVINDIWGREEYDKAAPRVGRGFIYGLLFPIYFALVAFGLISLLVFVIIAGIIAAIIFVGVWVTETILPHELIGNLVISIFNKLDIRGPATPAPPTPSESSEEK
jgi:uncharacterized BrkB/YihY/UPF0761 family membrane protein